MSDLDLKEGQLYLLDGNILVEASFNDTTGLWQLHEPEERSNWMVSPNGKLIGMQFDIARDVWLLEREPDVWAVADLIPAGEKHWHGATADSEFAHIFVSKLGTQLTQLED